MKRTLILMFHHTLKTIIHTTMKITDCEDLLFTSFLELFISNNHSYIYIKFLSKTSESIIRRSMMMMRRMMATSEFIFIMMHTKYFTRSFTLESNTSKSRISFNIINSKMRGSMRLSSECLFS